MPQIYKTKIDMKTGGNLFRKLPIDTNVPKLVERLTRQKSPFVFYTINQELPPKDMFSIDFEEKAIIGYGGESTVPFISDPAESIRGAVAIVNHQLVYGPGAIPLQNMRDKYTYGFSQRDRIYYTDWTLLGVLDQFLQNGYQLFISDDLLDYQDTFRFTIGKEITLPDLVLRK
jgi:hypothetical protein